MTRQGPREGNGKNRCRLVLFLFFFLTIFELKHFFVVINNAFHSFAFNFTLFDIFLHQLSLPFRFLQLGRPNNACFSVFKFIFIIFNFRSLKSIKPTNGQTNESFEFKRRQNRSQSPRRHRRLSPAKRTMAQNAAGVKLPPIKREEPIRRAL